MSKIISKNELKSWISGLMKERVIIAPAIVDDQTLFKTVSNVDDIVFNFTNTALSAKEWFFPTTEPLFTMNRKNGNTEITPISIDKESILFGIRPCDAAGLILLDKVFLASPADAVYAERRDKTTLIGLTCLKPSPECFCTSVGTAPNDTSNVDIMLTETEEDYIVEVVTEKGKVLLANVKLTDSKKSVPEVICPAELPVKGITDVVRSRFEDEYWSRVADRCIHCNICAYVCPVCHCFDIRDCSSAGKEERIRCWDSCQSPGFTRAAGGHSPRPTKASRLRQRFCHKLLYFPVRFDSIQCVGCGRCVSLCPVNIDIREIITDFQKLGVTSARKD